MGRTTIALGKSHFAQGRFPTLESLLASIGPQLALLHPTHSLPQISMFHKFQNIGQSIWGIGIAWGYWIKCGQPLACLKFKQLPRHLLRNDKLNRSLARVLATTI